MYYTSMIPLDSVLKDVYLVAVDYQVDEDLIMEFAIRALEHLSVSKTYDMAVCMLQIENNQGQFPNGMLGIEHVIYMTDSVQKESRERRFVLKDLIVDIERAEWGVISYDYHYEARVTNLTDFKNRRLKEGWSYLPLSDRHLNKGIICNPEIPICNNCTEWWYPDLAKQRFITSFESGIIAVTYYRYPQNEEGKYLIIDSPFLKDAIFNYVMSMLYLKLWLRGIEGAESKHKYFNTKWGILANAAIAELIKPSLPEYINMERLNTLFKKDNVRRVIGGYGSEIKNMR